MLTDAPIPHADPAQQGAPQQMQGYAPAQQMPQQIQQGGMMMPQAGCKYFLLRHATSLCERY